ncbi:hypothetical protein Tco_1023501, partial [Tanacetum coccineum]
MYVIEQPLPAAPAADSQAQVLSQWNAVYDAYNDVACLILGSMTPKLHRQFENSSPYDMIKELKSMFEKQAGVERFDLIQTFHACKQEEGKPVVAYVLQMKGYVDQLERLGYMLPHDLIVDYALESATRILNMVPTKKVDKTPYELWYGKVPNLSYLKGGFLFYQQRSIRLKKLFLEYRQEVSRRVVELEEIQDKDTSPFENTSEITIDVE